MAMNLYIWKGCKLLEIATSLKARLLAKKKVSEFNILRKKFHADKDKLKIEFPKKIEVPEDSEEEWCKFCLGSELSSAIYKHKNSCSTSDNLIEGASTTP
ncbi:hypothetical protein CEXT_559891 [Caerostris extrusa]|uniref:Uncharacterized protein n=1 Tax=Caerostris extrusa TaxID=172846 RepID=A0AAV4W0J8_CAEEX|nr:hypothetical protein CEXT_559891 [Caerostris extrusa]